MIKDVFVLTRGSLHLWADASNVNVFLKTFNLFSWETLLRVEPCNTPSQYSGVFIYFFD